MNVYKIKNKTTGLYKSTGNKWTKKGKGYVEPGHVTLALKSVVFSAVTDHFWNEFRKSPEYNINVNCWNLPEPWKTKYRELDKRSWNALPALWPDVVIQVYGIEGIREITLSDWIEKREN